MTSVWTSMIFFMQGRTTKWPVSMQENLCVAIADIHENGKQGRQRGHYGGGQPGVDHCGGGHLGPGNHPQRINDGGRLGSSGGAGMYRRGGRNVCNNSDSDSDRDSTGTSTSSLSSDDGLRSQREPHRPARANRRGSAGRGPEGRGRAERRGIFGRAATQERRKVQGVHTVHEYHVSDAPEVPDVFNAPGTGAFVGEGQTLGGTRQRISGRVEGRTGGRLGGRTGGMTGGRRGGNISHGSRRNRDNHEGHGMALAER